MENVSFSPFTHDDELALHYKLEKAILDDNSNIGGVVVGFITVAITLLFELISYESVRRVWRQTNGKSLYLTAVFYNVLNNLILGPLTWFLAAGALCRAELPSAPHRAFSTLGLLLVHSLGYYMAHAAMHRPSLYRFHKLHHRFHSHVCPLAANCVTVVEYGVAYMLPFVAGIFFFRPDRLALLRAVSIVSLNNILIHTPPLADPAAKYLPWFFVGTDDHLEHHARLTTKYAAPTLCLDRIIERTCDALGVEKVYWPGPRPKNKDF
jgi:sterol desaturase/sphingolipid hydroxylase (fatty acid hydroxylase superfamily)